MNECAQGAPVCGCPEETGKRKSTAMSPQVASGQEGNPATLAEGSGGG